MKIIKKLNTELLKKKKEIRGIEKEIDGLTKREILPALKKKYENKFFKTRNNYSCPTKPSDYWWTYEKVIKVVDDGFAIVFEFGTDCYGYMRIRIEEWHSLECLDKPITKKEFYNAFNKMKEKMNKMAERNE